MGPWNVIASPDDELTVIDWDGLEVRPRLWEVAHAAWAFVPLMDRNETDAIGWTDGPPDHGARLIAFSQAYGLRCADAKALLTMLPAVLAKAAEYDDGGAGDANRAFVHAHVDLWRRQLEAALE